jgi:hypothetical protein
MTDRQRIEAFKKQYEKKVYSCLNVRGVEFLGSCLDSWCWQVGKSDLDIIIYGVGIPGSTKIGCI